MEVLVTVGTGAIGGIDNATVDRLIGDAIDGLRCDRHTRCAEEAAHVESRVEELVTRHQRETTYP